MRMRIPSYASQCFTFVVFVLCLCLYSSELLALILLKPECIEKNLFDKLCDMYNSAKY